MVKADGVQITTSWDKAHQDNKVNVADLPLEAGLNTQADADVTAFHHSTSAHLYPLTTPPSFSSSIAFLFINDMHVTANIQQWIRDHSNSFNISCYIQRWNGLTRQHVEDIDWDSLGCSLVNQKMYTQIHFIKFMHD
eukprot:9800441-Ditylum_brightwellii.AAC.1